MALILRPPKSRHRERKTSVPISGICEQYTTQDGGPRVLSYYKDRQKFYTDTEVMDDVVTPGFVVRQRQGELINTPMLRGSTTITPGGTGATFDYVNGTTHIEWKETENLAILYYGLPTPAPLPIDVENLQALAQTAALANVKSSSFMGFVALAEGRKTVGLLASPLAAMSELLAWVTQLRAARKNLLVTWSGRTHRVINGRRFSLPQPRGKSYGHWLVTPPKGSAIVPIGTALSGSILAYDLGLYPFLCDIEAITKELPSAHQYPRETFRATRDWQGSTETVQTRVNSVVTGVFTNLTTFDVKVRATVVARDRFDIPSDFGVSLFDVPEAAWELVPYSFLIDYLVNVGDLLAALRVKLTRDIDMYCTVTTVSTEVRRTWKSCSITSGWTVARKPTGTDTYAVTSKERSPNVFHGQLAVTPISEALTPSHIKIALSLAVQQLTNLVRRR